ncbi:nucleotide sugar dehydrogenase [Omnitrophica bacterium]|nr:nucleotide sugar dehydrogenase [Candidatus Omnitrophota bacterium]
MYDILKKKIAKKQARLSVLGLGYVGLPLAVEFGKSGFFVYGIDVNKTQIEALKKRRSYISDVPGQDIRRLIENGNFKPTTNYSEINKSDVVIICVPTPLSKTREPDISYILSAVKSIAKYRKRGQLIVLESTTYPGTTDEIVLPILESCGLKCGKDFFLAFSPERVDPANKLYKTKDIPKIVGGVNRPSGLLAKELYKKVMNGVILVSSTKTAEMAKLLENTFRSVNIGLVNEIALMCNKLGLDVWETIDAAASKPFGFMPFYPGPGIGGHCIPLDPIYLAWKARLHGFEARFIGLADRINSSMPEYVVSRISNALNDRKKTVKGAKIHILGVSYKKDVSDTRESPALEIMRILSDKGAEISFSDAYTQRCTINGKCIKAVEPTPRTLKSKDCVAIITDHSVYDYANIAKNSKLLFDTRNATKNISKRERKVIKL